jgi:hypothetical protein
LCRAWCSRTDALEDGLAAKGFGFGGTQRERSNAALDGDGAGAHSVHRELLLPLLDDH